MENHDNTADRVWPPDELKPILVEMGRIVFNWNGFERSTTRLLNELIGGERDHKLTIVTAHMTTNTQLDALRTIAAEFLEDNEREHILHLVKLFERLRERRNFYVHAFDGFSYPLFEKDGILRMDAGSPVGKMRSISAKGRLHSNESDVSSKDLEIEAKLIHKASHYIALLVLYFRRGDNPEYQMLPEKFPLPEKLKKTTRTILSD